MHDAHLAAKRVEWNVDQKARSRPRRLSRRSEEQLDARRQLLR